MIYIELTMITDDGIKLGLYKTSSIFVSMHFVEINLDAWIIKITRHPVFDEFQYELLDNREGYRVV